MEKAVTYEVSYFIRVYTKLIQLNNLEPLESYLRESPIEDFLGLFDDWIAKRAKKEVEAFLRGN